MTAAARALGPGGAAPPGGAVPALGPFAQYSPYAWMLPQELWAKPKRLYYYTVEWVTPNQLAASSTATRTVNIDRDAHFAGIVWSAVVTNVDNTTFIDQPAILVEISDGGSGAQIMDKAVHFLNLFGRGAVGDGRFTTLVLPRLWNPGGTIAVTLQNLDATARHIRLTVHGFKVYPS